MKVKSLLAILIVVSLVLAPVAVADDVYEGTVYESLLDTFTIDDVKELIGSPTYLISEQSNGVCWVYLNADYGTIFLAGEDIHGDAHCLVWNNISSENVITVCDILCSIFFALEDIALDYNHEIAFDIILDGKGQYILNEEDAKNFFERYD